MAETTLTPIVPGVVGVDGPLEDIGVRSLLVFGETHTLLIDTLARPAELAPAAAAIEERGRPLLIVYSHADWDHWWGTAALPDGTTIAREATRRRQVREGRRTLTRFQRRDPSFNEVALRRATVTFEGEMHLDLGGIQVDLVALPGHTHDCLVAWVPQRKLLFAGDTAEDPIPLINEGPIGDWPARLREWAQRAKVVVPAHGAVQGPELLERNAAYLENLLAAPQAAVPELDAFPFYRSSHRRNLRKAAAERATQ